MMGVYRPLRSENGHGQETGLEREEAVMVPLDVWLDQQMARRERVIQELRDLDRWLVRYGRLKAPTLPQRVR